MKQSVTLFLLVVLYSAQWARAQTVTNVKNIGDYPYLAFLEDSYTGHSGNGAIISDTHVITAAVTIDPAPGEMWKSANVYVGNATRRAGFHFFAKNLQKHPQYNATNFDNNVAIVTIHGTFKGLPNVKPIGIRTTPFKNAENCFGVGWGIYINSEPINTLDKARRINYQLVSDQECAKKFKPQPSSIQCASAKKGSGFFQIAGMPLVCDHQLYGIQTIKRTVFNVLSFFNETQPIDIFAKLTAPTIQGFVFRIVPKPNCK